MPAVITDTDYFTAKKITGTPTQAADGRALFVKDQLVVRYADYPPLTNQASEIPQIIWKVLHEVDVFVDNGSITKYADQSLAYATAADPTTTRSVPGWNHMTTPAATISATPRSSSYFYKLQYVSGPLAAGQAQIVDQIHEMQITTLANGQIYVAANAAAMLRDS